MKGSSIEKNGSYDSDYARALRQKNTAKVKEWRKKQRELMLLEAKKMHEVMNENNALRREQCSLAQKLCDLNEAIAEMESRITIALHNHVSN